MEEGEQETSILKVTPRELKKVNQVPANEHATMQITAPVYRPIRAFRFYWKI